MDERGARPTFLDRTLYDKFKANCLGRGKKVQDCLSEALKLYMARST